MYLLPIIIEAIFSVLLLPRVSSSQVLFPQNQTVPSDHIDDDVLVKFFAELRKGYIERIWIQQIAVYFKVNTDIQKARPLLEGFPYVIYSEAQKCLFFDRVRHESFVLIFLQDLSIETLNNTVGKVLSFWSNSKFLFISETNAQFDDVWTVFTQGILQYMPYAELAVPEENAVMIYNNFFDENCTVNVQVVATWRPGTSLPEIDKWASNIRDLKGCPIVVATAPFKPKMMIEEDENGTPTIVGGREGLLVLEMAKKLNFTIVLRLPKLKEIKHWSWKHMVIFETLDSHVEFCIAGVGQSRYLQDMLPYSVQYDEDCLSPSVPRIINWSNDIVWVEFTWDVWVLVLLIFAICCAIGYVLSRNGEPTQPGFFAIFLDAVAIHLGLSAIYVSSSRWGKFILLIYLWYGIVITTAYKASLEAILATNKGTPSIVDLDGLVEANLSVAITSFDANLLDLQKDDSRHVRTLIDRLIFNYNDTDIIDRLTHDPDYVFVGPRSNLNYYREIMIKSRQHVLYDVLNTCLIKYGPIMYFKVNSVLPVPATVIIIRLRESGILDQWDIHGFDANEMLDRQISEEYLETRGSSKFQNAFIFYACCIALCLMAFVIELLVAKYL